MTKRGSKTNDCKRWLCIIGYAIVPVFFVILYLLMTETYEDISMGNSGASSDVFGILNHVYHYIPRLGEFYQQVATHFMTAQASFGLDLVFRLMTAVASSGVIYFSTVFVLGRRPKLQYKDVLIYLGIMLFTMISIFSETFTYRFSFANNYALALLVTILFLLLFRINIVGEKWWEKFGIVLLGFAFGISTEIVPIAFLILVSILSLVRIIRKEIRFKDFWMRYRTQTLAVLGMIIGLIFFYSGAGLGTRTSNAYADIYDYVTLKSLFDGPLVTLYKLVHHVWYNIRYVFFAFPLMGIYIFVEANLFKKDKKVYLFWQVLLSGFCVLFIGATSLIKVHDDLYARFMVPMFMAIVIATMLFIYHIVEKTRISEKALKIGAIVAVISGVVLVVDMTFAFVLYNRKVAPMLNAIHYNSGEKLVIDTIDGDYKMTPSPIFNLKQLPPFDWGPSADYTKFGL